MPERRAHPVATIRDGEGCARCSAGHQRERRSASQTFFMSTRHFAEGIRRGWCSDTSITSTAWPAAWASIHSPRRLQPRDLCPVGVWDCGWRGTDQGPAAVRGEAGRLHHGAPVAPQPGVPNAIRWLCRDASGDNGTQGACAVSPVLDARREGAGTQEPAGPNRGEASGWTPGTGIRQDGATTR